MHVNDYSGRRGESLAAVLLTRLWGQAQPLFVPYFLGEKAETLDFLVELIGAGPSTPFFFIQVKTTQKGYTRSASAERRLRVQMSVDELRRLADRPVPTYVVGIEEREEAGYLLCISAAPESGFSCFPTSFPMNGPSLQLLWEEVKEYWERHAPPPLVSKFVE